MTEGAVRAVARPALHFTPARGWINDPHGVTWHDGTYHAFYQHIPDGPAWAPGVVWGHATSPDLLSWTELPVALPLGDGDDGCFTGAVVTPDDGPAVMLYTSVTLDDLEHGKVRLAYPLDGDWSAWRKGPVVAGPPADLDLGTYRDPCVLRDGDRWLMLVGGATAALEPVALRYSSADLQTWTYEGPLSVRTPPGTPVPWTGQGWECPQLVQVGDRHVLVVSVWAGGTPSDRNPVAAAVGTYRDGIFDVHRWQQLTLGPAHFAASAFRFGDGGAGLIFWLRDVGDSAAGWMGALSLPYRLAVVDDLVVLTPDSSVQARRTDPGDGVHPAWDVDWVPAEGDELRLVEGDGTTVATLSVAGDVLAVSVPDVPAVRAPMAGLVRIVVDGPALEVWTGVTLVGMVLPTPDGVRLEPSISADVHAWRLD